jgi:Flp pilus assembly protein TadD
MKGGDVAKAEESFKEATELAPQLVGTQMQLALMYEQAGKVDAAFDRYRRILDLQPNFTAALNNLAYALAVHKNAPAEALPLAQRAVAAAPDDPNLLDTLGWIQHVGGDDRTSVTTFQRALRAKPKNAEVHLHAAIVFAANRLFADAKRELDASLELDPSLKGRADARELAGRLEKSTQ